LKVKRRIEIGSWADFLDSLFIGEMNDFRKMSKAELLSWIGRLKSQHDRSKKKHSVATAALADGEARLQAILDTAVEGIITIDERGAIESLNPAAEKIFGYRTRDLVGKNVKILMPSPDHENHDSYLANYHQTGHAKIIGIGREVSGRRKDGTIFPMDLSVNEVKLAGRRIFTGFVRDITERKQAEAAALASETRYRSLVVMSPDALFINRKERVVFINAAGLRLFGAQTLDQILGRRVFDLFHPDYHPIIHKRLEQMKTGQGVPLIEEKIVRLDGTIVDVEVAAAPFHDSQGPAVQVILRDITDRKQTEKALLHYAALVESSEDAIVGKSLDGYITSWNRGAETIFGYQRGEVIGKHISILIPPDRAREEPVILDKIRAGESVDHYETIRQCKDGRLIDISVTVSPIRDVDGRIIGASKVARDITERKRLEKEILEISDREQRRIGYDLHDGLCQHLAGIELKSQVLEQKLSKRFESAAASAGEISQAVREAIGQTRALARGLSPVTIESDGLLSALQELSLNVEKLFHIRCQFEGDADTQVRDHAAATHLFRLAQEAVSNAIKHGKAKWVSIQLKTEGDRLYLVVSDNGCGIPENRGKSKGMGLRIMQSRANMIGGTLTVERNVPGGTLVICSAPNPAPEKTKKRHAAKK
jgi:PAS domain S-box-containing protein